jgi:hypothetical protein
MPKSSKPKGKRRLIQRNDGSYEVVRETISSREMSKTLRAKRRKAQEAELAEIQRRTSGKAPRARQQRHKPKHPGGRTEA